MNTLASVQHGICTGKQTENPLAEQIGWNNPIEMVRSIIRHKYLALCDILPPGQTDIMVVVVAVVVVVVGVVVVLAAHTRSIINPLYNVDRYIRNMNPNEWVHLDSSRWL